MDTPTPPPSDPPAQPPARRVELLSPLEPAWARMRRMLFPFDIRTWCTVGFGCFLAKLAEGGFGGGGAGGSLDDTGADPGTRLGGLGEAFSVDRLRTESGAWLRQTADLGAAEVAIISVVLALVVALVLLIIYLSARSHFVFLDNVALERAAFWVPWREYRDQGHSLFLWRLGYFAVFIVGILLTLLVPVLMVVGLEDTPYETLGVVLMVVCILLIFLPLVVAALYVDLWLTEFVVPLMFQHRLTTTQAWRRFLPILRRNVFNFLTWGLLILVLHVLVGMAVLAAGIATCCIGLVLVIIPYVGTVLLLPLHLTYRAYSLEFFAQFAGGWAWPELPPADEDAPSLPQHPTPPMNPS